MEIQNITSANELDTQLSQAEKSYVLIYKKGSKQSDCAYGHYAEAAGNIENIKLLAVDVSEVRDIHTRYSINSAPTLLEFDGTELRNTIKGCHDSSYFRAILEDAAFYQVSAGEGTTQKRVVVYSTPTCSWCTTLKSYLNQHKIRYQEIDVSQNEQAAREMYSRSGQQGVPQTDIGGQMIVGFDKQKINDLLGIQA